MVASFHRSRGRQILIVFFVAWFLLLPLFWRLDTSTPSLEKYDMLAMAPYGVFHLVVLSIIGFFAVVLNVKNKKTYLIVLLLFGFYFPFIQLANYPLLTIRDVYLHSAPVETIISTGELKGLTDPSAPNWPSAFNLHAILTEVAGIEIPLGNYILYFSCLFLLLVTIFSVGKSLYDEGYMLGFAGALLFPALFINHLFENFQHFSRTTFAFVLLFLFFFSFHRFEGRRGLGVTLFLALAVIMAHPFNSLALLIFAVAYSLLERKNKRGIFTLFAVIAYMGWNFLPNAPAIVEQFRFFQIFSVQEFSKPAVAVFTVQEMVPWWGIILRDLFKYSLLFLFFGSIIVILFLMTRRRYLSKTVVWLSSIALSSLAMLFVLLALPDWHLGRFTAFAAFPCAFSFLVLIEHVVRKQKFFSSRFRGRLKTRGSSSLKNGLYAIVILLVVLLTSSVILLRFEVNYYYGQLEHSSELTALSFLNSNSDPYAPIDFISWRTMIYFFNFDYNSTHPVYRLWYLDLQRIGDNTSDLIIQSDILIDKSLFVVRGLRDVYVMGPTSVEVLDAIDNDTLMPFFNEYYSNGNYQLYSRVFEPVQ